MTETTRRIILNGAEGIVQVDREDMYKIQFGGQCYMVPSGVASLISDLVKEIAAQQNRRNVDRKEIEDKVYERSYAIARGLGDAGLLKKGTFEKIPLPGNWENDDGTKTEPFVDFTTRKIKSILSGVTDQLLKAYEESGTFLD